MKIYKNVEQLIGKTPLVELCSYDKKYELSAKLLAKVEFFNPGGSVKDRVAKYIIEDAENSGRLKPGGTIIEPTSGNTGIGLSLLAAAKGYRAVIVMPASMSIERQKLMRAYGAELVLTEGAKGMAGAVAKAEELEKTIPDAILAGQFYNPSNPKAHYATTGPEIYDAAQGRVDIFVAGIGTGGTLSGVGKYLKEKNPMVQIVGVEPKASPLITEGTAGPHKIQGIGANFVPENFDHAVCDLMMTVSNEDAMETGRDIARTEGLLVGVSSGAALFAARELAQKPENAGKTIVVVLPDTGERYLSTEMFE